MEKPERKWEGEIIPPAQWGRDHNSTLLYIETRAVDYSGKLDPRHLRGGDQYPTRLKDALLAGHTDFHCIDDFEAEGLMENIGTGINPVCKLTTKGWETVSNLRRAKAERTLKR